MRPGVPRALSVLARPFSTVVALLAVLILAPPCGSVPPPSLARAPIGQGLAAQDPSLVLSRRGVVDPDSDSRYVPARIGGIVGSYALSLLIVGVLLLLLSTNGCHRCAWRSSGRRIAMGLLTWRYS